MPRQKTTAGAGLSKEAWAAITAIVVAVVGAIATIVTAVVPRTPVAETASSTPISADVSSAIAHAWRGQAKSESGQAYTITVQIAKTCKPDANCGSISVREVPCRGELYLKAVQDGEYEFDVRNFDANSSSSCTPGAGEFFRARSDGKLDYRATWGVRGVLTRTD